MQMISHGIVSAALFLCVGVIYDRMHTREISKFTWRKDLENNGVKFQTKNSDSEVVFNGLSKFGISYIEKFVGQFAIFYLDAENMKIYLNL